MKTANKEKYVDGFVLVVNKKDVTAYKKMARQAAKIWKKYGAISYKECMGDDLNVKWGLPFPKMTEAKRNEVVFFSYITYKSKAHRDSVNKKVMADPSMKDCDEKNMPFDMKKMAYGGFKVVVD